MRTIESVIPTDDWMLDVIFTSGERKFFDMKPLLECEAFEDLRDILDFKRVRSRGYYIEWENEADLSADTLYIEGSNV